MVIGLFDRLSRPLMRALDPENAHALAIKALRYVPLARSGADPPELGVRAFGLNFPNPVGIAAGFDKNARAPDPLLRLGFGFVEVGTVTPRAQSGNSRPRLFRLESDAGVINPRRSASLHLIACGNAQLEIDLPRLYSAGTASPQSTTAPTGSFAL